MLPMMATLASMADWCASNGLDARSATALHLGAVLLPALLGWCVLRCAATAAPPRAAASQVTAATTCGLLLAAGGVVLWWPGASGLAGLMATSLLQGLAWGVGWTARWALPHAAVPGLRTARPVDTAAAAGPTATAAAAAAPALLAALLVLALGSALAAHGPAALRWVHGLLAVLGAAGVLLQVLQRLALRRWPWLALRPTAPLRRVKPG